jgi:CTP synthase
MEEQKTITQLGGTMRLGAYDCELREGSKAAAVYHSQRDTVGQTVISERHRHRYEFNSQYQQAFEAAGMRCVGINPASGLVEIVEIPDKKWYIGTQFHPEYSSTVLHPHPLFMSFIKVCSNGTAEA